MSRETRTIRPFNPPAAFADALSFARVRIGGRECQADGRLRFQRADEYLSGPPSLSWAADPDAFKQFQALLNLGIEASGFAPSDLSLVAVAYSRYLQIADVICEVPLECLDQMPRVYSFDGERPRSLQATTHGALVSVYVVLRREQKQAALRAWRKGTWLARRTFRFEIGEGAAPIFRPTPLTDEARKERELPPDTVRFLDLDGHDPFLSYDENDQPPTFFVDADLIALMTSNSRSQMSRILQRQLLCDFATAVALECHKQGRDVRNRSWEEMKDSLLGRIIALAAGNDATAEVCRRLLELFWRDPQRVIALIEKNVKLRQGLHKAFVDAT